MAVRPVFMPSRRCNNIEARVDEFGINFEWHPGFSKAQKQKSIKSLHNNVVATTNCTRPLEISSKSPSQIGVSLSAFNLTVCFKLDDPVIASVETVYQGSKVFDLMPRKDADRYALNPKEARQRARNFELHCQLSGWQIGDYFFSLSTGSQFYDWLYIGALYQNIDLQERLTGYDCFTDIEFNPRKSVACQARSAALALALLQNEGGLRAYLKAVGSSMLKSNDIHSPSSNEQQTLFG